MTLGMKLSSSGVAALFGGLVLAVTLLMPAVAGASVRSVTFTYDRPAQPRSLTPEPPITHTKPFLQSLTVRYDDSAGTLQAHMTVYDAASWQGNLPGIVLALDNSCDYANYDEAQVLARFAYTVSTDTDDAGNPVQSTDAAATFTRADYNGTATGTVAPAGDGGLDASFQHTALTGLDLRCVGVTANSKNNHEEFEPDYFDGSEPFALTQANATSAFKRALADSFGSRFTHASRSWALCPSQEFFPHGVDNESSPSAACMAHFKSGRTWRYVSALIEQGDNGAEMNKPYARAWTRKWRALGPKCLKQVQVKGRVASNDGACPALMTSDLDYAVRTHHSTRRAFWHGTNTAGFEKVARYRCKTHARTITCTNGLGDAFRWTR